MAYNSDGYIMLDFEKVNFTLTNQTIDGIFQRVRNIIGTNKFCLVINANHHTPLPSTVSITNNTYVIESFLYTFAVSSNDNLYIKKNDIPASELIDDNNISIDHTWSSYKINDEINTRTGVIDSVELIAGQTTVTIYNPAIKTDSWIKFFTSVLGVAPIAETHNNGSITLTFAAQQNNIEVGIEVHNHDV